MTEKKTYAQVSDQKLDELLTPSEKSSQGKPGRCLTIYAVICTFCLILAIVLSLVLGLKSCDKGQTSTQNTEAMNLIEKLNIQDSSKTWRNVKIWTSVLKVSINVIGSLTVLTPSVATLASAMLATTEQVRL